MPKTEAELEAIRKKLDQETKGDCASSGIAKQGFGTMDTKNKGKDAD